jgi:hypothetical protein
LNRDREDGPAGSPAGPSSRPHARNLVIDSRIKMLTLPHLYDGITILTYPFVFSPV